jgi:hypothetical protein
MAMAPTLVRVFFEKNKDLQDRPDNPMSSEARRQGRGGVHQTVQSALDVVVSGKHRPLNALDTSKGARGQQEHGTMMDGT